MIECYFQNHKGQVLDLMKTPYLLQTGEIYDSEWAYDSVELVNGGSKITNIYKSIKKLPLTLSILGSTKEGYNRAVNDFHTITDMDVIDFIPGKLYVDGYYLLGFFIDNQVDEWEHGIEMQDRDVTFLAPNPMWRSDAKHEFLPKERSIEYEYLDLPYDVPYDVLPSDTYIYLRNDFERECDFTMIVYGPVTNPSIAIDNHLYEVNATVYDGEYLEIDSEEGTIYRCTEDGVKVDLYNARNRESSVFEKIKAKQNTVSWNQKFGFDIILHRERGEPQWNLL